MASELKYEVLTSRNGACIAIDGHRVAGSKPLGGGTIERTMRGKREDVIKAIGLEAPRKVDVDGHGVGMSINKEIRRLRDTGTVLGVISDLISRRYDEMESLMLKYKLALKDLSLGQMQMPSAEAFERYAVAHAKEALGIKS